MSSLSTIQVQTERSPSKDSQDEPKHGKDYPKQNRSETQVQNGIKETESPTCYLHDRMLWENDQEAP